jgi:phosphoglycerol transferase
LRYMTNIATRDGALVTPQAKNLICKWGVPFTVAALSLLVGWLAIGGDYVDFHAPLQYSGDGLLILTLIKRLMENPWIFHSSTMGAPFGSTFYDYPIPDTGTLAILKLLGLATGSAGLAFNIYYLLGFPLNALAAYAVLNYLRVSRVLAVVGALAFTALPFHFLRIAHLFYTWYFAAPIFTWFALRIFNGELDFLDRKNRTIFTDVAILLLLSCFGVYYACFGVIMIITAAAARYAQVRSIRSTITPIFAAIIVTLGIIINVAPNIAYRETHGVNTESTQRLARESELYGLKITQLLLPHPQHRFAPFARLNFEYTSAFPLVNENSTSSLGLIGSIGFIILLVVAISPPKRPREVTKLHVLSILTLSLLLFCTIGGFSTIFSLLISPLIRAWNRASVFIGFTSICGTMLVADHWLRSKRRTVASVAGISLALLAVGLWDQTSPVCRQCIKNNHADFDENVQFISAIEKLMPAGSAIYQLPYMGFPETPRLNRLNGYDQALGYLQSSTLKWSYGTIKGRRPDLFFHELSKEPLGKQVEVIRRIGFGAIYLDRRGYADNGASIEAELTRILHKPPTLISQGGNQVVFDIREQGDAQQVNPNASVDEIMQRAHFVVDSLGVRYDGSPSEGADFSRAGAPSFLFEVRGLSEREDWGRWSDASLFPYVALRFTQPLPKHFVLRIRARGFGPNVGRPVTVAVGTQTASFVPTADISEFSLSFDNVVGENVMKILPARPASPSTLGMSSDTRQLGVGLQKLSVEAIQ